MPFESEKQRKFLHARKPKIAKKFEHDAKKQHKAPVKRKKK